MKKKVLSLILSGVLVLSATACREHKYPDRDTGQRRAGVRSTAGSRSYGRVYEEPGICYKYGGADGHGYGYDYKR